MPTQFQRYRPAGAIPFGSPPFLDNSDDFDPSVAQPDAFGPTALDDGAQFAPAPANGPNAQLQDAPQMIEPSARKDAMDQGAGKAPPPLAGAPVAPPPPPPPNVDDETTSQPDGPGSPPPPMAGAPRSRQDIALEQYANLKPPPAPHENLAQKIAKGIISFSKVGPEGAEQIVHPNYSSQMRDFQRQKGDLTNQVTLADRAEDISSRADARQTNAASREQSALTTAAGHGIVIVPAGTPPPVGYTKTVNPLSDNPKYANTEAWRDPNFGKFQVTPEQANLTNGAVKAGMWLPLTEMSGFIKGGFDQSKPDKTNTVTVSAATAKALGVTAAPDAAGNVDVPTSLVAKKYETDNKPEKVAPQDTVATVEERAAGIDPSNPPPAGDPRWQKVGDRLKPPKVPGESNVGTWSIQEDADGKPIEYNSKTGETRAVAAGGVQKAGTKEKKEAANEKLVGPARDALQYANDYLAQNKPTGPKDEALMEKFFELAKPSTGFRMSQPQIDMLKHAQGWMSGFKASIYHATTGTWFSDQQRKEIVDAMNTIANAKLKPGGTGPAPSAGGATGKITVTAPDGSIHPFATQEQANTFKKLAGIK